MRCGNRVCGANLCRGVALNVVCVGTVCRTGQWGQFRVFSEDVKADCSDYDEDGMGACECMVVYVALCCVHQHSRGWVAGCQGPVFTTTTSTGSREKRSEHLCAWGAAVVS